MSNPKIAEAGIATRFQKGNVPVSPGRPKKTPISDRYATVAELPAPEYLLAALKLSEAERQEIKTYGDALALSQFRAAIKGKTDAAREIADRTEGKARQHVEMSGSITTNLAELLECARKAEEP